MEMADSSVRIEDLKYLFASNVNVSSFLTVKLSGEREYQVWKSQMICLMQSQKMFGIVNAKFDGPGATSVEIMKQYDSLLKGWIFGSLSEEVLSTVVELESARAVWKKLKSIYDPEISARQDSASSEPLIQPTIVLEAETENIDNTERNKKLRKATVEGLWWEAEAILKNHNKAATEAISNDGNTMLHLAVGIRQNDFVEKLLDFIQNGEEVEKKNSDGRTSLHIAATVGNKYAAQLLVKKRKELLGISDHKAYVSLLSAYYNMQLNTFVYLLEATEIKQQPLPLGLYSGSGVRTGVNLLITAIFTKQYDLASKLVNIYPELATRDDQVLMAIARTFPSDLEFGEALIYPSLSNVWRKTVDRSSSLFYSSGFLYTGAKGILWSLRRFKNTYYTWLLPEVVLVLLAGRLAPPRILGKTAGAALQLQRELQWFEEVEKLVFPTYRTKENIFKETPEMVFTREHKDLVKEGETWMKTTAESCSIAAALITTIVFAAAITVPGGSDQEKGIPLFRKEIAFTIFAASDIISLFSSTTALIVFLSILTARFSEKDFLVRLPRRLIIGLCSLFLSTTAMMVAFSATLFLVFCDQRTWLLAPIGVLTCLPIAVFVALQLPLVRDLLRSTYFPIFGKQSYIDGGKFNPNGIQYFFGIQGIEYALQ